MYVYTYMYVCMYVYCFTKWFLRVHPQCEKYYPNSYQLSVGYSDIIEESLSNCRDGCDIALQTCQAGFYCENETMVSKE